MTRSKGAGIALASGERWRFLPGLMGNGLTPLPQYPRDGDPPAEFVFGLHGFTIPFASRWALCWRAILAKNGFT